MVDSNGKIITNNGAHEVMLKTYGFTVSDDRANNAFKMAKFVLDYEDFFDGTTVMVCDSKTGNGVDFIHKCGATVFRSVLNINVGERGNPNEGFYSFIGDNNAASLFTESWHTSVDFSLRASLDNAKSICDTMPNYCTIDEWKSTMEYAPWIDGSKFDGVEFIPVNQLEHVGEREYYGDIIFSRFVKEVYARTGKDAFFRMCSMRQFVDIEAEFAIVGEKKNMILLRKAVNNGTQTEVTLICSMDEGSGVFDYEKYDKAK